MLDGYLMTFRKIIRPEDLNSANRLYGGRVMEWADEAVGLFAMCQMKTRSVVTKKVSEIVFNNPGFQGEVLEFYTKISHIGNSSLTIDCKVNTKIIEPSDQSREILSCQFVFVAINAEGKPTPHNLSQQSFSS